MRIIVLSIVLVLTAAIAVEWRAAPGDLSRTASRAANVPAARFP